MRREARVQRALSPTAVQVPEIVMFDAGTPAAITAYAAAREHKAVAFSPAANIRAFFQGAAVRIDSLSVTTAQNGTAVIICRNPGG